MIHDPHPMLQPADAAVSPEDVEGRLPPERAALYRLLWSTTLACCLVPPRLEHHRAVADLSPELWVAVAAREIDPRHPGWTHARPLPPAPWPTAATLPDEDSIWTVVGVVPPVAGPTWSALLEQMESERIGTPASYADLLSRLVAGGSVEWTPGTSTVLLTAQGASIAAAAAKAGVQARAQLQRQATTIDAVAEGRLPTADALRDLHVPEATSVGAAIDAVAERWGQHDAESLRAAQRGAASRVPPVALPIWIDPERQLAAGHPWRAIRDSMERDLGASLEWSFASAPEQRIARWRWLLAHRGDWPEDLGEIPRFSALVAWLIGGALELSSDREGRS